MCVKKGPSRATLAHGAVLISRLYSTEADTSLRCATTDTGQLCRVFMLQHLLVPSCTAWRQNHMGVNNLLKVVTRQRGCRGSTRDRWITSLMPDLLDYRVIQICSCYISMNWIALLVQAVINLLIAVYLLSLWDCLSYTLMITQVYYPNLNI